MNKICNLKLFMKALAIVVKTYREKLGKSIPELSREGNISEKLWINLEKGACSNIRLYTLYKISEALNTEFNKLILEIKNIIEKL